MNKYLFIILFIPVILFAQVFDTLYLPDTLGGCADLDTLILNPVMNRIYVWSNRSNNMGVLDCVTGDRLMPIHSIPPNAHYLTWSRFVYNPNNNYLYESSRYNNPDTNFYVINCSTQAIIDTIKIHRDSCSISSFDVNIPANKIYVTMHNYRRTDSNFTYVVDARTNEVTKCFKSLPNIIHHKIRKIAYNYDAVYGGNPNAPLCVIDCENDTIIDSILLPPGSDYDKAFIVSEIDSLFFFRSDSLIIIDCANNSIVGRMQFPVTSHYIFDFSYNSINNKLYVATNYLYPENKIYIIDLNSFQIVDSLNLLAQLVYNPNTNHLYALGYPMLVIDGNTNQIIDEIQLPSYPSLYAFNQTLNKLFLGDGGNIFIVDCNQRQVERAFKMAYVNQHIMWQPVTNRLYINDLMRDSASSVLTVYDSNTNLPLKVIDLFGKVPLGEWFYHFTTATQVNKIYLTSGNSLGVYVLDGNTDSLLNYISCEVGGHYLLYNPNQNKIYTIPFAEFSSGYLYIIDCQNDLIRNALTVGGLGNGYFNPYNNRVYATMIYQDNVKVFEIDGIGDTIIKVLDSLGQPLAIRNKGNIHQVYIGSLFRDCIYAFDANTDSIIDSVMNVQMSGPDDQFFYYDSIDDRIYFPRNGGIMVIDCITNSVMDTIPLNYGGIPGSFQENNLWNPLSDRFYAYGGHSPLLPFVYIIDCQTNTVIDSTPYILSQSIMQLNTTNDIVYINDHWRSDVVAIRDNLIGITETKDIRTNNNLFIYPTIGNKFILRQKAKGEMRIYDVCGRVVKRVKPEETVIDGRSLTQGIYFLRVVKPENRNIQKFIVVR
jgi:DNA-binding beta-propeller fold protein YncE